MCKPQKEAVVVKSGVNECVAMESSAQSECEAMEAHVLQAIPCETLEAHVPQAIPCETLEAHVHQAIPGTSSQLQQSESIQDVTPLGEEIARNVNQREIYVKLVSDTH